MTDTITLTVNGETHTGEWGGEWRASEGIEIKQRDKS